MQTIYKMLMIVIYILLGAWFTADAEYYISITCFIMATWIIIELLNYSFSRQTVILYEYKELDYN